MHFPDSVSGQRQLFGYRAAILAGHDGVYLIAGLVVDLKHRAFQQGAGGQAVDRVVIRRLLHDLDLAFFRCVLPANLAHPAIFHIESLQLFVPQVAIRRFHLPDVILAVFQAVLDVDIPVLVGSVLADGPVVFVIQQKSGAVQALARVGIHLVH